MIAILDYGMGNVKSISNMLKRLGYQSILTQTPAEILAADRIILPGVGAFDTAMNRLRNSGLIPHLEQAVLQNDTPLLGICLGMQLLAQRSDEGLTPGLGWIAGEVLPFRFEQTRKRMPVPHMGWNKVVTQQPHPLFDGLTEDAFFYFVHSYHFVPAQQNCTLATATYGYEFTCAVNHRNITGVQFHPEKSHKYGMIMLKNFVEQAYV